MQRTAIYIIIFQLTLQLSLFGQQGNNSYSFKHYSTDQGLSNNWVNSLLEDDFGFMWFGTRNGLNRFDGYTFDIYTESNSNLGRPNISNLHKGKDNQIWVGTTRNGLYLYSWENDSFTPFFHIDGDTLSLSNNRINSITETSEGVIWIGTFGGGLNSVDPKTLKVQRFDLGPDCMRIRSVEIDHNDNLWIGSTDGLFYYDRSSSSVTKMIFAEPEPNQGRSERIMSLHTDVVGRLWVGTEGAGLFYLDQGTRFLKRLQVSMPELTESQIRKITSLPDGKILLASGTYGVLIVDPVSSELKTIDFDPDNLNSLSNNSVTDILLDSYGSMWVANAAGGVNFHNQFDQKFSTITHIRYKQDGMPNSNVRSIYQDRSGKLWLGTRAGITHFNRRTGGFKNYSLLPGPDGKAANLTVLSMMEDSKGRFWIGSYKGGVKFLDRISGEVNQFRHSDDFSQSLEQGHVYDLMEDKERNIWIATLGGIYVLDSAEESLNRYTLENSNLRHNSIRVLHQDSHNRIWVGTAQGLYLYHPEENVFESYPLNQESSENNSSYYVVCFFENVNGDLWVGTEEGGIKIINFEKSSLKTIGMGEGLPDNTINSIEKDKDNNFWISTNRGLCRYNEISEELIVYTREDGLQANDFYPNASLHSSDGEMYFGGPDGMNRFRPSSILNNPMIPKLVFTKLHLQNKEVNLNSEDSPLEKPLPLTSNLIINHKQTNFSIHFSGLGFINPQKYQYSYMLEGFEEEWSPFGEQRIATYTNLDKGEYTLKVMVKNNDNQLGNEVAELKISVLPAPWVTWWAYLIYLSLIVALLILFRYYILAWSNVQNELEFEKREKLQIAEVNQMKLRFFTNISHEFRTPLTLLRGYIEKLSPSIKDKNSSFALDQINRNSKRLINLVDELMDFRKAESGQLKLKATRGDIVKYAEEIKEAFNDIADRQEVEFTFSSDSASEYLWFDPKKIEIVLFNLLSNAFKYTPPGESVELRISGFSGGIGGNLKRIQRTARSSWDWIDITISDSGKGINEEDLPYIFDRFFQVSSDDEAGLQQGTGIGLAFSKRLVEIHKGQLLVASEFEKGSEFTVRLPVGSSHLDKDEIYETDRERFYLRIDYGSMLSETFGPVSDSIQSLENLPGKASVLIIEDNLQVLNLLKDSLSEHYNVIFALDGKSGLEMALDQHPDIILSDVMMPGISGIEVCNQVKCDPATSHIPVVLLTAKTEEETQLEGLNIGADAFLPKPFSAKLLIATIDNILENRKHLKEKFAALDILAPSELTRNKVDEHFLQGVISYVEDNLSDSSLDVVRLCKQMGMSRSVLYRKIKALTGHSIQEFIRGVRLRKAKQLLTNTNKSIGEISYLVGFSNTKHFSTSFKKEFELSPSEFRK